MAREPSSPPRYSESEMATGQRAMIAEGVFARSMEAVTSGVILAGFALALGASDVEIGLIAAIPFLAQLAHIPAVVVLGRYPDRRVIAVYGAAIARTLFFLIALVPFISGTLRPIHALIPLLVAYAVLATFSGAAWQVWIRELVPRDRLGAYFGRRLGILATVGLVAVLAAGQFLTHWGARYPGREIEAFSVLFVAGGLFGYVSSAVLSRAPSARAPATSTRSLAATLRKPFADANYRAVLVFLGAWGFAANISLPFVAIVLLSQIGYDFGIVTALAAVSIAANILGFKIWARFLDRFGNKPALGINGMLFIGTMLAWALVPKEPSTFTLAAASAVHVSLGFAIAGLDLAANNVIMKLAPDDEAPAFLASASIVRALSAGVAPLVGGIVAALLAGRAITLRLGFTDTDGESVVTILRFAHYDFLFLASAVLGLYAIHRLLAFKEEGEAPQEEVLRAMRREVLQVSSIAGMRQFASIGSYAIESAFKFPRRIVRRSGREREDSSSARVVE